MQKPSITRIGGKTILGGKCSCGGPVCNPKEEGTNKRFKKPKKAKGR